MNNKWIFEKCYVREKNDVKYSRISILDNSMGLQEKMIFRDNSIYLGNSKIGSFDIVILEYKDSISPYIPEKDNIDLYTLSLFFQMKDSYLQGPFMIRFLSDTFLNIEHKRIDEITKKTEY
ncbi:MAG: hypothetical protein LUH22_01470 [Bacteroides sp.]|nr:hypothetical protein [Bacteroides sp.]